MINLSGKDVLVTGAAGFIGHYIAEELIKRNANVVAIDNFSYVGREWIKDIEKDVDLKVGDVSKPETFKGIRGVDYIFHFGAPSSIVLFNKNVEKCYRETVLGQLNVFTFAREKNVEKVVYPSTGSVYGGNPMPHREDVYPRPRNIYGAAKLACEAIASSYKPWVKSTGLRIFAGYGPGEEKKGNFASVVYLFLRDLLSDKRLVVFGDGRQTWDFIYIEDVVKAVLKAVEVDEPVINVGRGMPVSFLKLLEVMGSVLNVDVKPKFVEKSKGYVENLAADTGLMERKLGIKTISIEEGVKRFAEYLIEMKKISGS